jgi:hypothetical protein
MSANQLFDAEPINLDMRQTFGSLPPRCFYTAQSQITTDLLQPPPDRLERALNFIRSGTRPLTSPRVRLVVPISIAAVLGLIAMMPLMTSAWPPWQHQPTHSAGKPPIIFPIVSSSARGVVVPLESVTSAPEEPSKQKSIERQR